MNKTTTTILMISLNLDYQEDSQDRMILLSGVKKEYSSILTRIVFPKRLEENRVAGMQIEIRTQRLALVKIHRIQPIDLQVKY